jgi:hypothetical protein
MMEQTPIRDLTARSEGKRASLERYLHSQDLARGARAAGPGPLEFDERGFPVAQRRFSFVERVTRLIGS